MTKNSALHGNLRVSNGLIGTAGSIPVSTQNKGFNLGHAARPQLMSLNDLCAARRLPLRLQALLHPVAGFLAASGPVHGPRGSVIDGDTIAVEAPGHIFKVRLFCIDCPESRQDGGPEATWFTTDMALDRSVTVIERDVDRYGRIVADIVLPDGRMLNKELVRSGSAWWYSKYDRADTELEALEAHAREVRLGL
jgi:micrococcal nuclease